MKKLDANVNDHANLCQQVLGKLETYVIIH